MDEAVGDMNVGSGREGLPDALRGDDVGRGGKGERERGPPGEERGDDNKAKASRVPDADGVRLRLGSDFSAKDSGSLVVVLGGDSG